MADSSAQASLLDQAGRILGLVSELASGVLEINLSPGTENQRRVASAWSALLPAVVEAGQSLPPEPSPLADWIREVGRVSQWFDGVIREHGLADVLFRFNCDGFIRVTQEGRALFDELTADRDPFEFVNQPPSDNAANTAFSLLDRFPATSAGHVPFLEMVCDEVHYVAEAKRQQLALGYSNDTLVSMVRGIWWAEAAERITGLIDLPDEVVEQVARVLRRELTIGTVEQIDELLTPTVRALRNALEGADDVPEGGGIVELGTVVDSVDNKSGVRGDGNTAAENDIAKPDAETPFQVNIALSQIRIDGISHDVPPEAARMAQLLLDNDGEWVAMRKHDFTKPSETKKRLPPNVLELIETEQGKGCRLKPHR